MPRPKQLQCLKSLSIDNILKNMDALWCAQFLRDMGQNHWIFVEGPFDTLPAHLCQEILSVLQDRKGLRKHHVYLLVSPFLKRLVCKPSSGASNIKLMLQLVSVRCRNLSSLQLGHCDCVRSVFKSVDLRFLDNLTELNLSNTDIEDVQLSVVGIYGSQLKALNLHFAGKVTEAGLRTLYSPVDVDGTNDSRYGRCRQNLEILDVTRTRIRLHGIVDVLLELGHQLKCFRHCESLLAVEEIIKLYRENAPIFALDSLEVNEVDSLSEDSGYYDCVPYRETFELVLPKCPRVTKVTIHNAQEFPPDSLVPLTDIPVLTELKVIRNTVVQNRPMTFRYDPTFEISLLPNFLKHATTLQHLFLNCVNNISLDTIVSCCTALKTLELTENHYDNELVGDETKKTILPGLTEIKFSVGLQHVFEYHEGFEGLVPLQQSMVRLLAAAVNLEKLAISTNQAMDMNQVFIKAYQSNRFESLLTLDLSCCKTLTMEAIQEFLYGNNCLQDVDIGHIPNITRRDHDRYEKFIKKNKLQVDLKSWR